MNTDNRTNEPSHNRIKIRTFRDGVVSIIHEDQVLGLACTLDELKRAVTTYEARGALEAAGRPAGTFTEAQVEAAAKAIADCHNPGMFERYPENWRVEARAALVAAQGAVPQEPSRLPDFFAPKPMPNSYVPAPVLPSSGDDEAVLIREAKAEALEEFADQMATGFNPQTLNAERRAIKREARARAAEIREGKNE